jgi:hypothetical protein
MPMPDEQQQRRIELVLAWLFPITYLIHVTEEYLAGVALAPSPTKIRGANLTPTQFLILHAIACVLIVAGLFISQRLRFRPWLMVCLGTVVMINGLFHVVGGFRIAGYNPGLASGLLIWIPLGVIALIYLRRRLLTVKYLAAVGVGVLINVIVLLIARGGRKLFEGLSTLTI